MPISRAKKESVVAELTELFGAAQSAVFIGYGGLTVAELRAIRGKLKEQGASMMVAKNNLIKIALANNGLSLVDNAGVGHDELCIGMTAVAFGFETPSAPAEVLLGLANDYPEIIYKGGFYGTTPVSGKEGVERISRMRSKEDALADVLRIVRGGPIPQIRTIAAGAPSRVRTVAGAAVGKLIALKHVLASEAENAA